MVAAPSQVKISADALRMRCRRLCERKPSGRQHVPEAIVAEYKEGGERREVLEMALLESLARHGLNRSAYKRVKAQNPCMGHLGLLMFSFSACIRPWQFVSGTSLQ